MKNLVPWKKKAEELSSAEETGSPFALLQRQMNNLFDDFFKGGGRGVSLLNSEPDWFRTAPGFEVSETDDEVRVKAEMPGMEEEDIEVTLDENILTIRGEKKAETEEKKRSYYVSELHYGEFQRSIPLPAGIDQDKVKARFKKGVLTLTLPKTEQAQSQRKRIGISTD
jgi:HSP20 family protein